MLSWTEFAAAAPQTAALFRKRLEKTGMALLGTLRSDGFPRISPLEPAILDDRVHLGMMPASTKSLDLRRDPRCCIHSATEDKNVADGDAKLWGHAVEVTDPAGRTAFAVALKAETGVDVEAMGGYDLWVLDITAGSSLVVAGDHLDVTIWKEGSEETTVHKY
jgi:hypothetical protein